MVAVKPSSIFSRLEMSRVLPFHCKVEVPVKSIRPVAPSDPLAKLKVPAFSWVPPVWMLEPVSVSMPVPILTSEPWPLRTPA